MTEMPQQTAPMLRGTRIAVAEAEQHLAALTSCSAAAGSFYTNTARELLNCALSANPESYQSDPPACLLQKDPWLTNDFGAKYLRELQVIRKFIAVENPVLYAPGHGSDVSHIEAFHTAAAIYNLEVGPEHVNLLRTLYEDEPHIHTALGLVENYVPPEKVDILFVASPGFRPDHWNYSALLKEDAFVITNASGFEKNPLLRYLGTCKNERFDAGSEKSTRDRLVETDAELLERSMGPGGVQATYASVLATVYRVTGKTDFIVERYNELRHTAVEQQISLQRDSWTNPERLQKLRMLGLNPGETEWTREDSERVRQDYRDRRVRLRHDGAEYSLKPLPTTGFRLQDLDVYRFAG